MKTFTLWFPVTPIPKGRPRFRRYGGAYTPPKTEEYERQIKKLYLTSPKRVEFEKNVPLVVNLEFGMPIPKSMSKKKRAAMIEGDISHTKKPDVDNLVKAILDGLNKLAWADDSQIVRISAEKKYAKEPYVYLYVHEYIK